MRTCGRFLAGLALGALFLSGCANPGANERVSYSHAFRTNLIAETERILAEAGGTLTFSNALALARQRSLKLAQQELEQKLARITRATAFSAFLPTVAFSGSAALADGAVDGLPMLGDVSNSHLPVTGGALLVAQPVFTPVAWVAFAETQYGVRIRDIARQRAGQLLDVQVALLFCRAAVAQRRVETVRLQLDSATALTNRLTRLAAEGYALPSDRDRAIARRTVAEATLCRVRTEAADARSSLCDVLNLWPLAEFAVDGDSLLSLPALSERTVAEWVWEGLVSRKDLYAGDQMVELRKAQVVEALAGFLPNVVLGGGGANASIADMAIRGWAGALTGTWAVFEGFRSVQHYRAARERRETEYRLQEDRMTSVVVAVAESFRQRDVAWHQAEAARAWATAARHDHAAAELRHADGQETMSAVLDKLAVRDDAELQLAQTGYAAALADVMLRQAIGWDLFKEDTK